MYRNNRSRRIKSVDKYKIKYPSNENIKPSEVRVIGNNGENLGVMSTKDALREAKNQDLDLVQIVPNAKPSVCKIIDWQKFKYQLKQKEKEQYKKQRAHRQKEIKFKSTIAQGDLDRKLRKVKNFLEKGRQVKVTVTKRGRQHEELFKEFKNNLLTKLEEYSTIASKQEKGFHLVFILNARNDT